MGFSTIRVSLLVLITGLLAGCANIVPPTGGEKDVTPPRLVSVKPQDSLLNTRVNRIELGFDEFLVLSNPLTEITISPILPFPLNVEVVKRNVIVRIPDTLLEDNTTYRIDFGKAIQDLHENNPFTGYSYMFSTGSYFDSLQLNGMIFNAATGVRDTGALVILYDASKSDSAILREKPLYAVKADGAGNFKFEGLPARAFKIYALRDANGNMVYDGTTEMVAFSDTIVTPASVILEPIRLDLFTEEDSLGNIPEAESPLARGRTPAPNATPVDEGLLYNVKADTSDQNRRTFDITAPLEISFNKPVDSFNINRINLSYDSVGITMESGVRQVTDTSKKNSVLLQANWKENTLYTLRLLKGFAKDSAGTDAMPGRFTFRTRRDEDYAKLHVHLPSKYYGSQYVFVLLNAAGDTVYQRPVTDTVVHFTRLQPGSYSMRVIMDDNRNGKWDTGDLLDRRQPEQVIPYTNAISLKAGWDNTLDFEQTSGRGKPGMSPGQRDAPK